MSIQHHLAQLNIARMRDSLDSPTMAGFVEQLDHINSVADRSEGFIWRLQTPDGNSTGIRAAADPMIIVNMSVWESVDALQSYVYRGEHLGPLRSRSDWFEKRAGHSNVLWWIPAGQIPRVEEGMARLRYLEQHGPSAKAFTFKEPFPATGSQGDKGHNNVAI